MSTIIDGNKAVGKSAGITPGVEVRLLFKFILTSGDPFKIFAVSAISSSVLGDEAWAFAQELEI